MVRLHLSSPSCWRNGAAARLWRGSRSGAVLIRRAWERDRAGGPRQCDLLRHLRHGDLHLRSDRTASKRGAPPLALQPRPHPRQCPPPEAQRPVRACEGFQHVSVFLHAAAKTLRKLLVLRRSPMCLSISALSSVSQRSPGMRPSPTSAHCDSISNSLVSKRGLPDATATTLRRPWGRRGSPVLRRDRGSWSAARPSTPPARPG